MRNSFIFISLFILLRTTYGQDSTAIKAKQAIHLEFGGTGQGVSLSYERLFSRTNSWKYGARAGVGAISFSQLRPTVLGEIFALKGERGNYLELGFGVSYLFPVTSEYTADNVLVRFRGADYLWLVPRVGYRRQNPRGDVFRIGWTPPIVLQAGRATFRPIVIGLSIGRSFNVKAIYVLLFALLFQYAFYSKAQNLVPNPSFEQVRKKPCKVVGAYERLGD